MLWRYYAFTFLRNFSFISAVLVPFFTEWGQISLLQVQLLQSWFMLWIFLLEIPTGAVADYLGRKQSLVLGGVIASVAAIIYGSVPRFEIFLLGEFLLAMSVALMSGADQAWLYDNLKEIGREDESKNIFGKAHAFHLAGILVGAPMGSLIAGRWGLNYPMLMWSIPLFLTALVGLTMNEPPRHQSTSESRRYFTIMIEGVKYFYQHRVLRKLAIDAIGVASAAYFVIWFYQPLLKNRGVGIAFFGLIHAFLVMVEILVSANFVRLETWFKGTTQFLKFGALATGLSMIIVALWPNMLTIAMMVIFAGGFGLTRIELISSYMNKHIPSEKRATVLSSISMFRRLALVILNPLVGLMADLSLSWAILSTGLLALIVFFFSPIKREMMD